MNNLPKTDKKFKPTYKVIILGKDGKKYKKTYKNIPPIHRNSNRGLPKNAKKMYSLGYIIRIVDYTLEEYNQLPEWRY